MDRDIPILILDPSMLFREGLRRILTEAGFQAIWCNDRPPMGVIPGLSDTIAPLLIVGSEIDEATLHLLEVKRLYPDTRTVILVESITRLQFINALRSGADTLIFKHSSCDALVATLRLVVGGVAAFPTEMVEALVTWASLEPGKAAPSNIMGSTTMTSFSSNPEMQVNLSTRERDVTRLLLVGLSNKEIARELSITEATVKVHVKAILRKAQVRNRTQVAIWASRLRLTEVAVAAE